MKSRMLLAVVAIAVFAGAAWADEIVLKNGNKLVGIAREEGKYIVVELPIGTAKLSKDDVLTITPGRTTLHEYREKAEAIKDSRNARDFVDLALWAKANGLSSFVRVNFEKAVSLDPSNEIARRGAGYTLQDGKWMTDDEVRRAQGFVKYDGRWVTQLEMELISRRKLEAEAARQAAEEARRRKQEEQEEARRRAQQEYRDRLEEMRRLHELYRQRYGYGYGGYGYGYPYYEEVPVVTFDIFNLLNAIGFKFFP